MIVNMSKYAFMVYHKEYDEFLLRLRDLGVVHVKVSSSEQNSEEAQLLLQQRKRIDETLKIMDATNGKSIQPVPVDAKNVSKEDGLKLLEVFDGLQLQKSELQNQLSAAEKDYTHLSLSWGNFSYSLLRKIKASGYVVHFFTCPISDFNNGWSDQYDLIPIKVIQSTVYFIIVAPEGEPVNISAEHSKLPKLDVESLIDEKEQLSLKLGQTETMLAKLASEQYGTLIEVDKQLQDEFNLSHVLKQTTVELDDKLMLLEGWLPEEKCKELEETLDSAGFFCRKLNIEDNDLVPIKLKNDRFVKLYEPICRMFSLPNYREFDPTPFFAPFFMLFFGLCFGDGGYGLLMLLVCTVLKRRINPDYKPYLTLFQYLGSAAIFVGALSGSFFGIDLIQVPAFARVKTYFLTSDNLMTISLVLGIIHILFGKTVGALKKMSQRGVKYGVAPLAWVFVIACSVVAFGLPMLNIQLSEMTKNVLLGIAGLSLLLALLYNSPGKNIFLNLGSGIWNLYNTASGLLGDTLSYIRLFAIGLTGAILGGVFNSLAIQMTEGMSIIPKILLMTIILLFGHSLNFGLCTISSLVHPLRLIFVEYYKNAEFEGGGRAYEPFKKA